MKKEIKITAGQMPSAAVLATCKNNIITIAWTGIVNSEKPMVYISVRKERYTHSLLMETMEFVINLPDETLIDALKFCGNYSGKTVDKYQACGLNKEPSRRLSTYSIKEAPVSIECVVKKIIELGTHDMFIGEIVSITKREGHFPDNAIVYQNGKYYGLKNL